MWKRWKSSGRLVIVSAWKDWREPHTVTFGPWCLLHSARKSNVNNGLIGGILSETSNLIECCASLCLNFGTILCVFILFGCKIYEKCWINTSDLPFRLDLTCKKDRAKYNDEMVLSSSRQKCHIQEKGKFISVTYYLEITYSVYWNLWYKTTEKTEQKWVFLDRCSYLSGGYNYKISCLEHLILYTQCSQLQIYLYLEFVYDIIYQQINMYM